MYDYFFNYITGVFHLITWNKQLRKFAFGELIKTSALEIEIQLQPL